MFSFSFSTRFVFTITTVVVFIVFLSIDVKMTKANLPRSARKPSQTPRSLRCHQRAAAQVRRVTSAPQGPHDYAHRGESVRVRVLNGSPWLVEDAHAQKAPD